MYIFYGFLSKHFLRFKFRCFHLFMEVVSYYICIQIEVGTEDQINKTQHHLGF